MNTVKPEIAPVTTFTPEGGNQNEWWKNPKIVTILGLLYAVSPIDVIPDFLPFVGWCDDLAVIGYVIYTAMTAARKADADDSKSE